MTYRPSFKMRQSIRRVRDLLGLLLIEDTQFKVAVRETLRSIEQGIPFDTFAAIAVYRGVLRKTLDADPRAAACPDEPYEPVARRDFGRTEGYRIARTCEEMLRTLQLLPPVDGYVRR